MIPGNDTIYAVANVQLTLVRYWMQGVLVNGQVTAGAPIDSTGYSARFMVKKLGIATTAIDVGTADGAVVLTPSSGKVTINLSRAQMTVAAGEYHYYLILTSPGGIDYPLLEGRFVVAIAPGTL